MVAAETRGRVAAQQASGSIPWIGVYDSSEPQRLQADHEVRLQETANLQLGGPGKFTAARVTKNGAWRTCGTWMMSTFCVTQSWCRLPQLERSGNHRKTEVICSVNDRGAVSLGWRIGDVQKMAKVSTATAGSITLEVAVAFRQYIAEQLLGKADIIRAMHERVQLCQDPQTEFALRESLGVSRINHILRFHGHTILEEQSAAEVYDEIGQRSLERLFQGLTEDSITQATLSAGQSGIGFKRARDIAAPALLGALIAAKPCIQALIQDAATAGFLPRQPLETRFAAVVDKAISTFLEALHDQDKATAKLFVHKAAQAAEGARQQTTGGLLGPRVTSPTVSDLEHPSSASQEKTVRTSTSQRPGRADSVRRSSKRSFQGKLLGLDSGASEEHTPLPRSLAASYEDRRLVPHARLPKVALSLGCVCGKCLDAARLHHQRPEKTWNSAWTGIGECRLCGSFLDPQLEHSETCSTAEATR